MAQGHAYASKYPLSKLWIETEIARERVNGDLANETSMMHAVIIASLSPKDGNKILKDHYKRLNDGY